jgi:hypothetical protein
MPAMRACPSHEPAAQQHRSGFSHPTGNLSIAAFFVIICPLARTHDHAEAALTCSDTPGTPARGAKHPGALPGCLNDKL